MVLTSHGCAVTVSGATPQRSGEMARFIAVGVVQSAAWSWRVRRTRERRSWAIQLKFTEVNFCGPGEISFKSF